MSVSEGNFRSSLFGGFNRADVVKYIRKTSEELSECTKERDDLRTQCDELGEKLDASEKERADLKAENAALSEKLAVLEGAEERAKALQAEIDSIRDSAQAYEITKERLAELEVSAVRRAAEIEQDARTAAEAALDRTDDLIGSINNDYNKVKDNIESIIGNLNEELDVIGKSISTLMTVLDKSSEELSAFRDEAYAARDSVLGQKTDS